LRLGAFAVKKHTEMKILYYDCFAGISGDMNLGAMIDLGVNPAYLKIELKKLNIEGFKLKVEPDMRRGISGTKVSVIIDNPDNEKHHHLRHVEEIVNNSALSKKVKSTSLDIFRRIAEAEARVHNIDIQKVHFHEVGALDSIADIVGAAICLDYLNVDKVLSSPIQLGGGTVKCAHGVMPVPAPATALIVENIPVKTGLVQHEATTPTGAAILAATVDEFTGQLNHPISKTAYGIGQRDVSEVPNILRLYLCETNEAFSDVSTETETMLECNIDDMNAEHFGDVLERILQAGASDAWFTPVIMKKSRPATKLSVLCKINLANTMKAIIFEHTTTLGIREYPVQKNMLRREEKTVKTSFGEVRVKESFFNGKRVNAKPEYNDCKQLADKNNVPVAAIENEVRKQL